MLGNGGWEGWCLRLCPNPEMPEKAPRATSSPEVGHFPQPPLACADQAWSGAGHQAIPTYSSSRQPGLVHRPQFPSPCHIYKKEGVWALGPSTPFPEKEKGLQSVDLSPAVMASDACGCPPGPTKAGFSLSTLETQCSYLFLSELGKNNKKEILFLPLSLGWGECSSLWGRRLGQQKLTDIFRDMGIK